MQPRLFCIDEAGYLSLDSRYADLLFEGVTRRYDGPRSIVLSTNKPINARMPVRGLLCQQQSDLVDRHIID